MGNYRIKRQHRYLAFDSINNDYYECDTIEEARETLKECFLQEGMYHPDLEGCCIYELKETASYDVIADKESYEEDGKEWKWDNDFDEIWKHKFIPYSPELLNQSK